MSEEPEPINPDAKVAVYLLDARGDLDEGAFATLALTASSFSKQAPPQTRVNPVSVR